MDGGQPLTGRMLCHYLVLNKIGEGSMGVVYRAEDTRLGRIVALKFLDELAARSGTGSPASGSGSARPQARQRFWREARAASALSHPGICTVYAVEEYEDRFFIAMELLEGRTLRQTLDGTSSSPLPAEDILDIGLQVADALDAAHSQQIVHRDIKPANLFITSRGRVKILDFGLAKRASREIAPVPGTEPGSGGTGDLGSDSPTITLNEVEVTTPGSTLGTMAYMSPEQARAEELDARTDLFSFAAVLYEMATGRRAFPGRTWAEVGSAILNEDPPPAIQCNPQLPPDLSAIIQRGLAKRREDRYQTAAALRDDLRSLRQSLAGAVPVDGWFPGSESSPSRVDRSHPATPPSPKTAGTAFSIHIPRRRTWLLAALGAVLLVSVGLLIQFRGQLARIWAQPPSVQQQKLNLANVSLAVLPFSGAQNDPELRAFGSGLAEALTGRLIQLTANRSFQVTPASEMKDRKVLTLAQARQEFGATVGLDLTVERSETLVRVTYTLIDARTGRALGGNTVTLPDSDLLALEDRLEESVVGALGLELRPDEKRTLATQAPKTIAPQSYNYYLQGLGYLRDSYKPENVESAFTVLGEALKLDPQFGLAEAALGEAYWSKFENTQDHRWIEPARAACAQAVKMGNAGAEGHECLGAIANGRGDYTTAAEQFQIAVQLDPTSDRALSGLGAAYQGLNQLGQAEATYQRAIELRPQYWRGYNMLGALYSAEQEFDKARQMFTKAVELAPDSYRGYANLSAADLALNRRTDAIHDAQHSIEIRPNDQAYTNLATADFYLGNYDQAARNYRQAVAMVSSDYVLWGNLAEACYYGGHKDEALKCYRRAAGLAEDSLKVNPRDTQTLRCLAGYYSMICDRQRAIGYLDRARSAGPPDQALFYNEALVYNQFGETDVALEWLAKALAAGLPPSLAHDVPAFNNLHDNPRFQQLLAQH